MSDKRIEPVDAEALLQILSMYARKYRRSPARRVFEEIIDRIKLEDITELRFVDFLVELYQNGVSYEDIKRIVELIVPADYVGSTLVNFKQVLYERRVKRKWRRRSSSF